jgi:hypothetical protein
MCINIAVGVRHKGEMSRLIKDSYDDDDDDDDDDDGDNDDDDDDVENDDDDNVYYDDDDDNVYYDDDDVDDDVHIHKYMHIYAVINMYTHI